MAILRTNFGLDPKIPKYWKGLIPSSNWEKNILNEDSIKFRFENLNDDAVIIRKGDKSLLSLSIMAYNCMPYQDQEEPEPEYDENDILVGFWDDNGCKGISCPDNFSVICMAAAMQHKGRELRKLKKLAEKQKEAWYLTEYQNILNYYRKVME